MSPAPMASAETGPILLVEDNPAHAELITRALADHCPPAQILHLNDGEQAIDYLFHRGAYAAPSTPTPTAPHLILLDLRLPKLSGIEVLAEVKGSARTRHIPVVILTTSAADQDVERAYRAHANSYLVKPVDFDGMNALIASVGRFWLVCNHHPW